MLTRRKRSTRCLTAAAICAALGVVLLALGAFVEVLDLSAAAMASFLIIFAVIELRGKWPYLIYAVTALLSLLLLPIKSPAVVYALLLGHYPILKEILERRCPRIVAWVLKILLFNVALAVTLVLSFFLLMPGVPIFEGAYGYVWIIFCTPVFLLYDVALTRLITFYLRRLRHRIGFLRNF